MWEILVILELHGNNVGTTDHPAPPALLKTESWIALIICDHIYLSGIRDVVLTCGPDAGRKEVVCGNSVTEYEVEVSGTARGSKGRKTRGRYLDQT
jgi:hypothetical protein